MLAYGNASTGSIMHNAAARLLLGAWVIAMSYSPAAARQISPSPVQCHALAVSHATVAQQFLTNVENYWANSVSTVDGRYYVDGVPLSDDDLQSLQQDIVDTRQGVADTRREEARWAPWGSTSDEAIMATMETIPEELFFDYAVACLEADTPVR